ncbi:WHG domain-containing protein [Modestobacter sp. L9-4]|uniref:TetR/AcrR family transcriptional regulator n=1 Tax=Modestobacter sp. L9-4 TaxID=2851567 RepID=UPI001C793DB8|nr:TetR-like C-terminal domain-containing protein [Modestobacter sp. L9-4]QXG76281.1 WHG domain-containing protein [Modestobacter sp. L9-4]
MDDENAMKPVASARAALLAAAVDELTEHGHAGISLRAVARRAGLSHAAPKYHFDDRAGLLTAVATQGFRDLAAALGAVDAPDPEARLAALGAAYIDFGVAHPALFDLMFRAVELDADDAALREAQHSAIGVLAAAAGRMGGSEQMSPSTLTVMAWALVHGLVVLARDGSLRDPGAGEDPVDVPVLAHSIAATFSRLAAR